VLLVRRVALVVDVRVGSVVISAVTHVVVSVISVISVGVHALGEALAGLSGGGAVAIATQQGRAVDGQGRVVEDVAVAAQAVALRAQVRVREVVVSVVAGGVGGVRQVRSVVLLALLVESEGRARAAAAAAEVLQGRSVGQRTVVVVVAAATAVAVDRRVLGDGGEGRQHAAGRAGVLRVEHLLLLLDLLLLYQQLLRGVIAPAELGLGLLQRLGLGGLLLLLEDHRGVPGGRVARDRGLGHVRHSDATRAVALGRRHRACGAVVLRDEVVNTAVHPAGRPVGEAALLGGSSQDGGGTGAEHAAAHGLRARSHAQGELVEHVGEEQVQAALAVHVGSELRQLE